jgi:hypothetical protein
MKYLITAVMLLLILNLQACANMTVKPAVLGNGARVEVIILTF